MAIALVSATAVSFTGLYITFHNAAAVLFHQVINIWGT